MNHKPLPIGIDNFEAIISDDYYFVDKSLLIKDLIDNKAAVNLFTRPRRFGKTLNISMIKYFFEDDRDWYDGIKKDNSYLFQDLKIMNAGEEYTSRMGKYPVINLSLKSAKQGSLDFALHCLKEEISNEFKRHQYILKDERLVDEREKFMKIAGGSDDISLYITSLRYLSECLSKHFNKKVIILIDEYDVPLENSFFRGFYEEMVDFLRSLFESSLKTNPYLEFAVMTGCLRISKESIFTGLNNLKIISILNDRYDEYFGFTDSEVEKICDDYNMTDKYTVIKEWYNGYMFGNENVYNPWSVMQYVDDLTANINKLPSSYWANTSSNSIVKSFIEIADDETKSEIEDLIEGKSIEKPVHEDITYDEIYKSTDNLYNFMFFSGYFKKVNERIDERTQEKYLKLKIPNKEVKYIFRNKVLNWFDEKIKSEDLSELCNAVVNGDVKVFEKEVNRILRKTISFNDAYENFYHGFLVGILSGMKGYVVKSNREAGDGRSDICIKPVSIFKRAVIIEIKVCDKPKELFTKCYDALQQIEEKKYDDELQEEGYQNTIKYGIAFYRKDCVIKIKE